MKKIITLCLFVFALLVGSQTAFAQKTSTVDREAISKTEILQKQIGFDDAQADKIYEAIKEHAKAANEFKSKDGMDKSQSMKKINDELDRKLKGILTEKQYETYIANKRY